MKLHIKPFLYAALMAAFLPVAAMADTATETGTLAPVPAGAVQSQVKWGATDSENPRMWDTEAQNWGVADGNGGTLWKQVYQDGAKATFTSVGAGDVTLGGELAPSYVEVSNAADVDGQTFQYTFTGPGRLTGGMKLVKGGGGTLTIETGNTYSGGTEITAGTLVTANTSALGTGAVTLTGGTLDMNKSALTNAITVNATAVYINGGSAYNGNLTLTSGKIYGDAINLSADKTATVRDGIIVNALTGKGKLVKETSGTVDLLGAGSYSGGTTIKAGTLTTKTATALGTGTVTLNSGTLDMCSKALGNTVIVETSKANILRSTSFNGNLTLTKGTLNGDSINLGTGKTATLNTGTVNNRLSGLGKVVKDTTGTVTLTGANAYKGGTTLKAGTLVAKSDTAFGSGEVTMTGGTLKMGGYALANTVNINGASAIIRGSSAYRGNLVLTKGTLTGDAILLSPGKSATLKSGTLKNKLTGTGKVVKTTSGTAYLTGNNSYGNTYVEGGTLIIKSSSSLGTGAISITGGTLDMGGYAFSNVINVNASKAGLKGGTAFKGNLILTKGTLTGDAVRIYSGKNVSLKSGTLNNKLTGTGIVIKDTASTVNMGGASTYTGTTYLKAGTLVAKSNTAFGTGLLLMTGGTLNMGGKALPNTVNINTVKAPIKGGTAFKGNLILTKGTMSGDAINLAAGKTATFKTGTVNNKLTGAGAVVKETGGAVTISGANTYKGGTTMKAGTLTIKTPTSLGTGTVTLAGGTFNMGGKALTNTVNLNGSSAILNGATAFRGNLIITKGVLVGQNINVYSGKSVTLKEGSIKNNIVGAGKLIKDGAGTASMAGTNTYKGGTVVKAGTLSVNSIKALGSGAITVSGGEISLHGLAIPNDLTVNCTSATLSGTGDLRGKFTLTKGTIEGGWINVAPGKNAYLQSGAIKNTIYGKGHVYKTGTGTVTLSGENFWEGNTYVQGGTLAFAGPTNYLNGSVYTYKGGKLDIQAKTTVGNLTLGGGSVGLRGGVRLSVTGTLTLASATKLALTGVTDSMPALIKFKTLDNKGNQDYAKFFGVPSTYKIMLVGRQFAILKDSPALKTAARDKDTPLDLTTLAIEETYAASLDALGNSAWGTAHAARLFDHTVRDHAHAQSVALDAQGKRSVWFAGMSGFSHVDDAADFTTTGGVVGMQFNGSMGGNTGIAIGQTFGHVSPAVACRVKQQTQHAALYGTKMLYTSATDSVSLTGTASYGTTDSDYHQDDHGFDWAQHSAVLGVRGTWEHKVGQTTGVYGFAGLEYLATDSGDTENGKSGSAQALQGSIGAGISHTQGSLTLHADVSYTPDMVRHNPVAESDGTRSGVRNPGRNGFGVSAGATYRINDKWSINAGYSYHNEKHADSHDAYIGARCTF